MGAGGRMAIEAVVQFSDWQQTAGNLGPNLPHIFPRLSS